MAEKNKTFDKKYIKKDILIEIIMKDLYADK
jgi:hypothetical protein